MKTIIKNQKMRVFSFSIVLMSILLGGVFMQSCSNEDEYGDNVNPQMESLINSTAYKRLNKNVQNFGKEVKSNYSTLSEIDKDKVIDILTKISDNSNSQQQVEQLFAELYSYTQIDFKTAISDLNQDIVDLNTYNEINNTSKRELLLAIEKSNYRAKEFPRLKGGNENEDYSQLEWCITSCGITSAASLLFCVGPQAIPCSAAVLAVYALCCALC